MPKIYVIKKNMKPPKSIEQIDKKRRQKIEETLGKKMTDYEWIEYKKLVLKRQER